jgi:excisionase family DNA binding protein
MRDRLRIRSLKVMMDSILPCSERNEPLLVPVEEAARLLGIGRTMTYRYMMSGELRSVTLGRRRLISVSSLEDFVASRTNSEDTE